MYPIPRVVRDPADRKIWRVLFPTTPETADDEARLLSDAFIQQRLHHLWNKEGDYTIGHRTLYNVNQRVAETYYRGRVILAGMPAISTTRWAAWA